MQKGPPKINELSIIILEKCKTLRGEPELIMSCTHDSLKFLGAKWNLLNDSCMIDEVTAAACMHNT